MTNLPKDYSYSQHRRILPAGITGHIVQSKARVKKGEPRRIPYITRTPVTIIENRRDGLVYSVTVLDNTGRAMVRLDKDARY